ncbi:MAG TPA: hypothetical protein VGO78_06750 [Acidimicrobiales bacterium]|nr:hypothetical protein [Acidimicrobiales bacterium]
MRRRAGTTAAAGAALLMALLTGCNPRQPWHSQLLSSNGAGTDSGNGESASEVFSPDGDLMAFESIAPDLGPTDTNGHYDVFLRDMATGAVSLISANAAGTDSGDVDSWGPVISPDGTDVAFVSLATDLDAGITDANERPDVYVRDLVTGTTTLVSVDATGTRTADDESGQPAFSPDGTRIAFYSEAADLGPADANGDRDVYLRDLTTGTTTLVSVDGAGTDAGIGEQPTFSPDGGEIAFVSWGDDLGPTDGNEQADVYLRDLAAGTTSLVSVNAMGTAAGDSAAGGPAFSPDGSAIAFTSSASDLGPTDTHPGPDVYLRDLTSGTTTLVSANATGTDSGFRPSSDPTFSPDGGDIAFVSSAFDLGPTDTNEDLDVYVRDLGTDTTALVSTNGGGTDSGNANSYNPRFGPDGRTLLFESIASDLGATDTHGGSDIYLRDLEAGTTTLVSTNATGTDSGNRGSVIGRFRPGSDQIAFTSAASDLGATDTNGAGDVYLATYHAADLGIELDAAPEPVASGGQLTYGVTVTNGGPDTADDASVGLLLPEGVTFDGATASSGTCAATVPGQPRLVVCDIGDVADGDTVEVTVTADVTALTGSSLTALASARSGTADVSSDDDTVAATSTVS